MSFFHNHKKKISITIGALILFVVVALSPLLNSFFAFASNNPPCGAGGCYGAIGLDTNNNVSIGTSTTQSNTRLYITAATSALATDYAFRILDSTGASPLFVVQNDGSTGIKYAFPSEAGYALYVNGDIYASGNLYGNIASGYLNAANVTEGVFGSSTASALNSKYAFPSSLGVGTSSNVGLPQALSVYGTGYFSSGLAIGTTSIATNFTAQIEGAGVRLSSPAISNATLDLYPNGFGPAAIVSSRDLLINSVLTITSSSRRVGVGTSSPAYNLDVAGTFRATQTSTFWGNVGIGTSSPQYPLDVSGTVRASGDICTYAGTCLTSSSLNIGTGAPYYVARWKTASTLETSTIFDTGVSTTVNLSNTSVSAFTINNGAFLATGTISGGGTPTSGAGIRMMWIPAKKGAFRAGELNTGAGPSTYWNDSMIGDRSTAFGYNTRATGINSFAIGDTTYASGTNSFAGGDTTTATGINSFAIGDTTYASGANSFAGGIDTIASGANSFAFGNNTISSGISSAAIGNSTLASGNYSFATGDTTTASGVASFAAGSNSSASGVAAIALGNTAIASASSSVAIGSGAQATQPNAVAIGGTGGTGNIPIASGAGAVAIGKGITVSGQNSIGIGSGSGLTVSQSNVIAILGANVGVGQSNPQSTLHVGGPITVDATSTSASMNVTTTIGTYFVSAFSGNATITIPSPSASTLGRIYHITKTDSSSNKVIVSPSSGFLYGTTSTTIQYSTLRIVGATDTGGSNFWISTRLATST